MNAYSYDDNTLKIENKQGNRYNLKLRGWKTIITGDSGTGKTFLVDLIKNIKTGKTQSKYNVDNIETIDSYIDFNIQTLKKFKKKLIIIDAVEDIIPKDAHQEYSKDAEDIQMYIAGDTDNKYLIFTRIPLGIGVSPNHYGEFIVQDGITTITYEFNVKGWD